MQTGPLVTGRDEFAALTRAVHTEAPLWDMRRVEKEVFSGLRKTLFVSGAWNVRPDLLTLTRISLSAWPKLR
jgi:hypothetical protein